MSILTPAEVAATIDTIAEVQQPSGLILWYPGGHADPWNHVEAAMALALGGYRAEAEHAYDWLVKTQHFDGSWCTYYLADGVWHHWLLTGDRGFVESLWPTIEPAIDFVLRLQRPGGEIIWSMDPDGTLGRYALLTGSSSIVFSLRCAIAIAELLGHERPEWELAAGRLAHAVAHNYDTAFEPKTRWAMDWYYPVLCGAMAGEAGRLRIAERWDEFVMPEVGVRCVSDRPWVTAAETAECVMALDAVGLVDDAHTLLAWTRHLRDDDGSYWTGCVHPQCVNFPGGERSTYTAAAVVLATEALVGSGPTSGLFRGETIPAVMDLAPDLPVTEA